MYYKKRGISEAFHWIETCVFNAKRTVLKGSNISSFLISSHNLVGFYPITFVISLIFSLMKPLFFQLKNSITGISNEALQIISCLPYKFQ